MKIEEYMSHDGIGLASLVRNKDVTSQELVATATSAANQVNPALNAVVEIFADELEPETGEGPFGGVPFFIKDFVIMAKGRKQEMGSRLMEGFVAPFDSHLMKKFRAAGLVPLGRTATPEFAFNVTTEPLAGGAVRNPWNPEYMAGGSSGGAAASVAAGIVPLAHATDGGGSIRLPASCCGVFGLKPSRGRVSPAPFMSDPLNGLGVEFAVSRSVRDSAALLDCVEGPAPGDRFEIARPEKSYTEAIKTPPTRLKIGMIAEPLAGQRMDDVCGLAVHDTAGLCQSIGHEVEEVKLSVDYEKILQATLTVWASELAHGITEGSRMTGRPPDHTRLEATTLACHEYAQRLTAFDYLDTLDTFNEFCRSSGDLFARYDVLLSPTCSRLPQVLGTFDANDATRSPEEWVGHIFGFGSFTLPWNITGQPAMSVPLYWSPAGLPVGSQFVGRFGDETTLLKLAAELEAARPWFGKWPSVNALHSH